MVRFHRWITILIEQMINQFLSKKFMAAVAATYLFDHHILSEYGWLAIVLAWMGSQALIDHKQTIPGVNIGPQNPPGSYPGMPAMQPPPGNEASGGSGIGPP